MIVFSQSDVFSFLAAGDVNTAQVELWGLIVIGLINADIHTISSEDELSAQQQQNCLHIELLQPAQSILEIKIAYIRLIN